MAAIFNLAPIQRLRRGLAKLESVDPTPILETLEAVLQEDNRRGVMGGIDGDDQPMIRTTYRMSLISANANMSARVGELPAEFTRKETNDIGSSLKTSEYKKLSGPPLAPRGEGSRVISNYRTNNGREGKGWFVEGSWIDILSRKGVPFIGAHFRGLHAFFFSTNPNGKRRGYTVNLPRRNLVGLRKWGRDEARAQVKAWAQQVIAESILKPFL